MWGEAALFRHNGEWSAARRVRELLWVLRRGRASSPTLIESITKSWKTSLTFKHDHTLKNTYSSSLELVQVSRIMTTPWKTLLNFLTACYTLATTETTPLNTSPASFTPVTINHGLPNHLKDMCKLFPQYTSATCHQSNTPAYKKPESFSTHEAEPVTESSIVRRKLPTSVLLDMNFKWVLVKAYGLPWWA